MNATTQTEGDLSGGTWCVRLQPRRHDEWVLHGELYFLSRERNANLLELAGFRPQFVDLNTWLPYPHVMFVSRPV